MSCCCAVCVPGCLIIFAFHKFLRRLLISLSLDKCLCLHDINLKILTFGRLVALGLDLECDLCVYLMIGLCSPITRVV